MCLARGGELPRVMGDLLPTASVGDLKHNLLNLLHCFQPQIPFTEAGASLEAFKLVNRFGR